MRTFSPILLSLLFLSSNSGAAPTASEQTRYDNQVQALINRINSHRSGLGRASLQPLNQLCIAAQSQAEFELLGTGPGISVFDRATSAGYTGNYITTSSSMASFGTLSPAALPSSKTC